MLALGATHLALLMPVGDFTDPTESRTTADGEKLVGYDTEKKQCQNSKGNTSAPFTIVCTA
jgi:hypothetical protein